MNHNNPKIFLLLFFVIFFVLISPGTLYGAGANVDIGPLSVDYELEPGVEKTFEIMIANNNTSETLTLGAFISPIYQNKAGEYKLKEEPDQWSANPWIVFKPETISIPPNTKKTIPVTVKIPRSGFGTKYAAVAFQVDPDDKNKSVQGVGGALTFKQYFLTIVKVTAINRANRRNAALNGITLVKDSSLKQYGDKAMAVSCAVANEGNVLLNVYGRVILKNSAGKRIKDVPLGTGVLLPGASVDFQSIFPAGLPEGEYTADISINYGGSRPLFAKTPIKVVSNSIATNTPAIPNARFDVSPETVIANLAGGSFRSFSVTVVNLDKSPLQFSGFLNGLTSDEDDQLVPAEADTGKYSLVPWLKLEQPTFTLAPGEKKIIKLVASVPKDAGDGTRYAALTYDAQKVDDPKSSGSVSISTPVMITVGKEPLKKAELSGGGIVRGESDSWIIGARILNLGNTHLTEIKGKVVLRRRTDPPKTVGGMDYLGEAKWEELKTIPLVETNSLILPDHSSLIGAIYKEQFEVGQYQADIVADIGNELPVKTTIVFKIAPRKGEKGK